MMDEEVEQLRGRVRELEQQLEAARWWRNSGR